MATETKERLAPAAEPMDRLKREAKNFAGALGSRAVGTVLQKVEGTSGRLLDYAEDGAGPGLTAALTGVSDLADGKSPARAAAGAGMSAVKKSIAGLFGKSGGGAKHGKIKVTNIVESIDVAAPVRLVYDQWTQFADFPSFMKKVESVEQEADEKLNWKAQIFWSHRTWQSTIKQQVPDKRIVWASTGQKGHVDGAVTFHELDSDLTRVLVVLEYHPQGLFEHSGNMWRAQGRRVRLELKHFRRHVMTQAILHPDEIQGWRGVIEDGEVVKDHQTAVEEEEEHSDSSGADGVTEDRYDEDEDDYDLDDNEVDNEPEDEYKDSPGDLHDQEVINGEGDDEAADEPEEDGEVPAVAGRSVRYEDDDTPRRARRPSRN